MAASRLSYVCLGNALAGEKLKFLGDNMKKIVSIFAAMALVGSLTAQKKAAPAAEAAPAAPARAEAAPAASHSASSGHVASGKAMGLSFGLSFGFVTDMFKQGDKLKQAAFKAGGGALETTYANAKASTNGCVNVGLGLTDTECSYKGEGSSVALNGLDIGLRVQYDIMPWLFVRSGANFVLGLKNTYTLTRTQTTAAGLTTTNTGTMTANGSIIEIPLLVGFNLISTEKSSMYFAAGLAFNSASYETVLSASQTVSAGTAITYMDVINTTKQSGIGVMWLIGGKTRVADGISVFGEVKFLSAAAVAKDAVTGTKNDAAQVTATNNYANTNAAANNFAGSMASADTVNTTSLLQNGTGANFNAAHGSGSGGLDLSYTRWQIGVQYEM